MAIPALQNLNQAVNTRDTAAKQLIASVKADLKATLGNNVTIARETPSSLTIAYNGLTIIIRTEIKIAGFQVTSSTISSVAMSYATPPQEMPITNYSFDDSGNTKNPNGTPYSSTAFADAFIADTFAATLVLRP